MYEDCSIQGDGDPPSIGCVLIDMFGGPTVYCRVGRHGALSKVLPSNYQRHRGLE